MFTRTLKCLDVLIEDFVSRIVAKDHPPIITNVYFKAKNTNLPVCCPSSYSHYVPREACGCKASEFASIPQTLGKNIHLVSMVIQI